MTKTQENMLDTGASPNHAETREVGQVSGIHSVTIIGRRWFQRGPGNTYHTATILINGQPAGGTGRHYGYGDQYVETAFTVLENNGKIPPRIKYANGSYEAYWQWAERNNIALNYSASDVSRKRDL